MLAPFFEPLRYATTRVATVGSLSPAPRHCMDHFKKSSWAGGAAMRFSGGDGAWVNLSHVKLVIYIP
jgi:hypothetical protein